MKRPFLILLCAFFAFAPVHAETDGEVAARRTALGVAGAFVNDGFKLRDGHWAGSFASGKPEIVQVNLYAGNQYWFTLGATPPAKKVAISIYDETGKPVKIDADHSFEDSSVAAAGFSPDNSGIYFVKVAIVDGAAADFCLVYSYK